MAQDKSKTGLGVDQFCGEVVVNLSTEIVYIHIDKVGAGVEIDMPDLLLDV